MPRLTNKQFLDIHHKLRRLWLDDPRLFAELIINEQWHLHDFFGPDYDWPDDKMLIRRGYMTKIEPSLPQKAGRTHANF